MNNDYVKRSDVHKAFQPKYAPAINRTFAAMIDNVPAADVRENVMATMEIVESQPYFKKHYRRLCCSNCKREVLKSWSFCPDCGAQFTKEKKNE